MKRKLFALFVPVLAACSLTEVPPPPDSIAINECGEEEDEPCAHCSRGACVEPDTNLEDMIIEVTPPATAPVGAGLAFYTTLKGKSADLAIGPVATVTGSVKPLVDMTCVFEGPPPDKLAYGVSDGSIPVSLTFTPSERVLGVAAAAYPTVAPASGWMPGSPYEFRANLPPGGYDLYIEPRSPAGTDQSGCRFPPFLLRGQVVSGGVTLAVEYPEPRALTLSILLPVGDRSIAGWTVDMLDSRSGRRLSTREIVSAGTPTAEADRYAATLVFIPAHGVGEDGAISVDPYPVEGFEIIRLSPPEGVVAPSFLFQRDGVGLLDATMGLVDLRSPESNAAPSSAFPVNVAIEGQTAEAATGMPVEATVTLNATRIEGSNLPAYFSQTFEVDATGRLPLTLPAGTYQVRAVPKPGRGLAAAQTEWQIRAVFGQDVVAGKLIELGPAAVVGGEVTIAHVGGAPFGATATALVSPLSVQTDVLAFAAGKSEALPRASTDIVARSGRFSLTADPGTYDVYIRPEPRSRYPWFVRPSVTVPPEGLELEPIRLSLPVIHHGNVSIEDGDDEKSNPTVPGALIRAYARVTGPTMLDGEPRTAVVPVAETRANENGAFELLIPATLDVDE